MSLHGKQTGYVGLGSNIGNPETYLSEALHAMRASDMLDVTAVSDVFFTEPQGLRDQAWFANRVAKISVPMAHGPHEVLRCLSEIEKALGRERRLRWGPRTIDLDLLILGEWEIQTDTLILPHPRMHERAFVLLPLLQIDQHICIHGRTPAQWLEILKYRIEGNKIWQK